MNRKYRLLSLFSGCGGLDTGFHKHGFLTVGAVDNDMTALQTYRDNISRNTFTQDVRQEEFTSLLNSFGNIDVLIGGFPCQGFSKAGPKNSDDPRNSLYLAMVKATRILKKKVKIN